ncbi:MAG: transcriptional regulator [Microbacterium sp.]|nr:MAG: transcriptional regulator [Microbacterium sp.]
MRPGPRRGAVGAAPDYVAKAHAAWGTPPDWIVALAEEATRATAKATAARLGYSTSVVTTAITGGYRGSMERLEQLVRGALMDLKVDCPVLGEIGRDRCLMEQREPFRASSAHRAQLFHACNTPGRCPHSKASRPAIAEGGEPS